ncbi:MAG: TfoX/Sxy family protein [Fulvivirga sp.]
MAYNEHLAERIRQSLKSLHTAFEEKKMMGGLTFMVNTKMCVGIVKNDLMARIGPDAYDSALEKPGVRPMDFTKKPMKGYVFIAPEAIDLDSQLDEWIAVALNFNRTLV